MTVTGEDESDNMEAPSPSIIPSLSRCSTPPFVDAPVTPPPLRPRLLRPRQPVSHHPCGLTRTSHATVWQLPFDSIEWVTGTGRRATAFITIPDDRTVCYRSGVVSAGFLSGLCHEITQRCCEDKPIVALTMHYHRDVSPGTSVVLAARTVEADSRQRRMLCTISTSVASPSTEEAIATSEAVCQE
ncbi:hypothetical protein PISL3812_09978 [Talaromyces islandicus]|uniref:Thioesterase domain-containing protein n=1 Tax=Talaromyces islandicus TaxID=28573 RepID=A0A0U1MCQ4_TALIS|nr:hypothetical protein PISL3812_09978 [Talaromyces islandicus]